MVFGSQLTSGTVFGEEVGCRLLMFHLKSLCFISCCCVLCWEQFFVFCFLFLILYFCMPFAKWCCFCTRKKLLGNSPVARVWLFWKAGLPEILYLVVIINRLILKCCLLGHLLIKDFSNMSEWGQLMLSNSPWTKEDYFRVGTREPECCISLNHVANLFIPLWVPEMPFQTCLNNVGSALGEQEILLWIAECWICL